jgi:ornithine cyclodeaminase/alanine dehydrogenase-like protein (mu-crystallin family)
MPDQPPLSQPLLILDRERVAALLSMDEVIAAVRRAALLGAAGGMLNLPKQRLALHGEVLHVLGAVQAESAAVPPGQRWLSTTSYVTGSQRAHWNLLFNGADGLVAVIEGRHIAWLRTGAASAVSVDASARPGPVTVAMIGAGHQAWTQVLAISRVREITDLPVWSRTAERAQRFTDRVAAELGLPARPVTTAAAALADADVAVAITKATDPVMLGDQVRPGTHVVLAGSSHIHRSEGDPRLFARAAAVYTDDIELGRVHGGALNAAVQAGALRWESVSTLGEVVAAGQRADGISVFCSHGVGSWDLEVAVTAYQRAINQKEEEAA